MNSVKKTAKALSQWDTKIDYSKYPSIYKLMTNGWQDNSEVNYEISNRIKNRGIYIFGAHKVGLNLSELCSKFGINVLGFFDNDD